MLFVLSLVVVGAVEVTMERVRRERIRWRRILFVFCGRSLQEGKCPKEVLR